MRDWRGAAPAANKKLYRCARRERVIAKRYTKLIQTLEILSSPKQFGQRPLAQCLLSETLCVSIYTSVRASQSNCERRIRLLLSQVLITSQTRHYGERSLTDAWECLVCFLLAIFCLFWDWLTQLWGKVSTVSLHNMLCRVFINLKPLYERASMNMG